MRMRAGLCPDQLRMTYNVPPDYRKELRKVRFAQVSGSARIIIIIIIIVVL